MNRENWKYSLRWSNPYTNPPTGLSRVLAEWNHDPSIAERIAAYPSYQFGCGFAVCIEFPWKPRQPRDEATKLQQRERTKKTLEANRVRQKLPLLADVIIAEHQLDWRNVKGGKS